MTDKPAKTAVPKKRRKFTPYSDLPQKQLNVDQERSGSSVGIREPKEPGEIRLTDVTTLIRVITEKNQIIEAQASEIATQRQAMRDLYGDIVYLRNELDNPNLFVAE